MTENQPEQPVDDVDYGAEHSEPLGDHEGFDEEPEGLEDGDPADVPEVSGE